MTADRGSGRGTSGTATRPAPSRFRPDADAVDPELRTDTERPELRPDSERDSRPETDRRDVEDRDEREDRELLRAEELLLPLPPPVMPVGGEDSEPFTETTGARPQVSQ